MHDFSDMALVREYVQVNSEAAFAELVERHIALVYSAAFRHSGQAAHAQEITQAVFIILARKAAGLRPDTILAGWLCETARLTALSFLRGERRRQRREQEAYMQSTLRESTDETVWNQLSPLLDEALSRLGRKDRDAVVLCYFKDQNLREVAAKLNINEPAAQKRVNRALEKLRKFFTKRGVTLSSTVIAGAIADHSVSTAPVGLAKTVTTIAVAKGTAASASTLTLIKGALKIMAWTNMKTAIVVGVGVLLLVGTTTYLIEKNIQANQYTVASNPWSDIGAATPKAALESLAWALTHDKFDRAQELMQWDEKGLAFIGDAKMEQQLTLMSVLRPALKDIESFKILSIRPTRQPDELIVKLLKTFKNRNIVPFAVTAKLRRVGNQWRVVANLEFYQNNTESMLLPFTGSF